VRVLSRIGALPNRNIKLITKLSLMFSLVDFGEGSMSMTIIVLLAAWLGLNVVFGVIRFYVTAGRGSHAKADIIGYPRLVN